MKKPMCSPCRSALPQHTGSFALGRRRSRSAPTCSRRSAAVRRGRTRYVPTQYAIQLSMIVVITSCAPTVAFRKPAIPRPERARDASPDDDRERTRAGCPAGSPRSCRPRRPRSRPSMYWPWPPMLNIPQRKANATASPVRISGVVRSSVCWRLNSASIRVGVRDPREEPVQTRCPRRSPCRSRSGCGRSLRRRARR